MSDEPLKKFSVTSFDVAKLAGVSRSAVSRAFTPGTSISEETRNKVLEAATELGYRVNLVARGMNKQRTDLVGMIASVMSNPYRAEQIDALAKQLVRKGFSPMLFCIDEGMDEEQLLSILLNYKVSGVIITSDAPPVEICEECARLHVPLALVGRADALPFVDHINGNDISGGMMAADTLIDAGRQRLLVLKPKTTVHSVSMRIHAFSERALKRGFETEFIELRSHEYESGSEAAASIAPLRDKGLGIFCPTDVCALGLLDALRNEHGVKVPEEMSLIGYDDIPQAKWKFADLTTIKQPVDEFARVSVELLQARIINPKKKPVSKVIEVTLINRSTV